MSDTIAPFTYELQELKAIWTLYEENIVEDDTEAAASENSIRVSLFLDDFKIGDIYYRSEYILSHYTTNKILQKKFVCNITLSDNGKEYQEYDIIKEDTLNGAMKALENHIIDRINHYTAARNEVKLLFQNKI